MAPILSLFFLCSVALSQERTPLEIQDELFAPNQEALAMNIQGCYEMILKGAGAEKLLSVQAIAHRIKNGTELLVISVSLRVTVIGLPDVYHHSYLITKDFGAKFGTAKAYSIDVLITPDEAVNLPLDKLKKSVIPIDKIVQGSGGQATILD